MRSAAVGVLLLAGALCSAQDPAQDTLRLTLAEAERIARQNNPQISAAQFTAQAAGQVPAEFRANLQPSVSGVFTGVGADTGSRLAAGGLNNPIVYNRIGSGLAVNQLITDFGRTGNLVESARLRAQSQEQAAQATQAQVVLAADRAYFGVLRAQALLQVAQGTVQARQLVADQAAALAEAKLMSNLDVSFANVNLAEAKLLLAGAQNDVKAAKAELATALGIPGQRDFTLTEEDLPDAPPDDLPRLVSEAVRQRPELANLRLEQNAEERFVRAERALIFPTVGLIGTAGLVPAGQPQVPGRYGAAGLNVTVPVLNGGLFRARRLEAEARSKAAAQNVRDLENRVARDVRVAALNAQTAYERVGLAKQLLDQAQSALELAQGRYDLGLSSIVELSQAQLSLTSAQITGANAKYDYQIVRSVLAFQLGALR